MKTGRVASLAGAVAIVAALWASTASAATLVGDYQFQGSRASSGPGPALIDLAPGTSFQTDTVMGETRQVMAFTAGAGLKMSPLGIANSVADYSVVTTFRFDNVGPHGKVIDAADGASNTGVYVYDARLDLNNAGDNLSATQPLANNTYATVALVVDGAPLGTRGYVNGNFVVQTLSPMDVVANNLRFFIDNTSGGTTGENAAGAVSCIRVFLGALTSDEVTAIGANPRCGAPGPPSTRPPATTKKKCKKKKKHRAAELAKKKCKKKPKR